MATNNNFSGKLSKDIFYNSHLENLFLNGNNLNGEILDIIKNNEKINLINCNMESNSICVIPSNRQSILSKLCNLSLCTENQNKFIKREKVEEDKNTETLGQSNANVFSAIFVFVAITFCVSFGSVVCLKNKGKSGKKKNDVSKVKCTKVDLSLPYPSTIPQKKDSQSNCDSSDENNKSFLKPIINERSVSIRRSIIIDNDYSSYCGFSPFPAPGFQFIATYDYTATNDDELSLKKNEPLLISSTFEDGWAFGKKSESDLAGFFPISCLGIGPCEDDSDEPTDTELNLFNQMIIPKSKRFEE